MNRIYLVLLFIFVCLGANAQYQGANWPLAYHNLMLKIMPGNFERDSLPDCPYDYGCSGPNGFLANASISDSAGNLLLFSFGEDIHNKYGNLVEDGTGITEGVSFPLDSSNSDGSDPHYQGALFLPQPGSASQYYLFIKDWDSTLNGQPSRVTATLTDVSANNDSGKVLRASQVIMQGNMLSDARMTACQHANGRDWWLINHQYLSNVIYIHLITPDSIYGPFEQSIGLPGLENDAYGCSVFSADGRTFATTTEGMGGITLLDFDRCNGTFSNFKSVNTSTDTGYYFNLAFSPNGRFLYAANSRCLEQYDLQASNIADSRVQLVHDTGTFSSLGQMVLMPDGKIYMAGETIMDSLLSVIDSPNIKAPLCNFHLRSILVTNSLLIANVPNFPTYNIGPVKGSSCDTLSTAATNLPEEKKLVEVIPNPADQYFQVTIARPGNYSLELLNDIGKIIETKQTPQTITFNTNQLARSFYFIRVIDKKTGVTIAVKKVAIVH